MFAKNKANFSRRNFSGHQGCHQLILCRLHACKTAEQSDIIAILIYSNFSQILFNFVLTEHSPSEIQLKRVFYLNFTSLSIIIKKTF